MSFFCPFDHKEVQRSLSELGKLPRPGLALFIMTWMGDVSSYFKALELNKHPRTRDIGISQRSMRNKSENLCDCALQFAKRIFFCKVDVHHKGPNVLMRCD